jgi:hypothetical protein
LQAENQRLQNALGNSGQERADRDADKKSAPSVEVSLDGNEVNPLPMRLVLKELCGDLLNKVNAIGALCLIE